MTTALISRVSLARWTSPHRDSGGGGLVGGPETVPWGVPVRTLGRLERADGGRQYGSDQRVVYNPPPGDYRSAPPLPPAVLAIRQVCKDRGWSHGLTPTRR